MKNILNHTCELLIGKKLTISTAESCTGGLLSNLLTQNSGSSTYFTLGVITYSNKSKENLLKIPAIVIKNYGAVSKEVALLMANNVRRLAKSDFGIGITGIAGPSGGTPQKPVGTVFIGISNKTITICKKFSFKGSRSSIRNQAALKSLQLLKLFL
jgi:nicotinamide-nucleotide amidase